MISPVLFYLTAFVVIFGALMMVAHKNILYSALSMVLCFIGVAGVYATLQLSFFAVVQIMVYVGAITILTVFAIMLTRHANQENFDGTNPFSGNAVGAGIVAVLVAVVMAIVIRTISLITPRLCRRTGSSRSASNFSAPMCCQLNSLHCFCSSV